MGNVLRTIKPEDLNKKKANDIFSQFISNGPSSIRDMKLLGPDGYAMVSRDVYLKMVAEKLWDDIACYINYADASKFEFMLSKLPVLADPYLYPGYQKHVKAMKKDAEDFAEFEKNCKKILYIRKDRNMYLSVLAYMLTANPATRPMIEGMFKRNEEAALRHIGSEYASRELVKYDFDVTEFYHYRMALALCIESETDAELKNQIRGAIKKAMPDVSEYVERIGAYLEPDNFADGFFGPFLFIFRRIYSQHSDVGLILRLILSIYEICLDNGYPVHDDGPMFVAGLFFAINSSSGERSSTVANIVISKCKDAIKSVSGMRFDNEFTAFLDMAAFLINWNGIYIGRDVASVIQRLKALPKKKLRYIVGNFITAKYILVDTDYDNCKDCMDYVEKNLYPILSFFKHIYVEWYSHYSYSKKEKIACFADNDDKDLMDIGIGELSLFFNLFIDHARLELSLADMAQKDVSFRDIIQEEQKQEEESAYRQRCLELETECRKLKSSDTNSKALMAENAELKRKIAELSHQTSQHSGEREKDKKELIGLRNLVHELSSNLEPEQIKSKASIEEMGEYLNKNVKGVIIGGHINVHNKLDKYIPKWKKYAPETKITLNALKNNDIVVMFSDYLNHSSYFGAIECVRESDCKLLYVHNVNMEYVMTQIYNACKEGLL